MVDRPEESLPPPPVDPPTPTPPSTTAFPPVLAESDSGGNRVSPVEIRHEDGQIEHPRVRFEHTDISFFGVLTIILIAALLAPLHQVCVMLFFKHEEAARQEPKYEFSPPATGSTGLPAEPRLEQLDRLAGIKSSEVNHRQLVAETSLNSYGPTPEDGFVHVPIDWAIEQVVARLPTKPTKSDAGPASDRGLIDAGEPNSGRMFRGR